jgi:ABC-type multidrug transport system fused ATPase/permease subunit
MVASSTEAVLLLLAAARMSPELTAVAMVAAPVVVLPVRWLGHRRRERARTGLDARARLSGYATETWSTVEGLQAASAEGARTRGFDAHNRDLEQAALRSFAARLLPSPLVELAAAVRVALVIVVGGGQVVDGTLAPGELIAFLLAVGLLNDPLKGLAEVNTLAQRAAAGASTAFGLLDRVPALVDGPEGPLVIAPEAPLLSFHDVRIDYGDGPVVDGFSLSIDAGEIVALAGPSGAGKTSLARLVPRLMDPSSGHVCIGGARLDAHDLASVRAQVAVVGQEPVVLDATVAENIALAYPEASVEAIEQAARAAGAHDFIAALPAGYRTPLGERGSRLSGGQRQRICIARALLQDAPVVVLDEPTSALDAGSEAVVQDALDRLCAGRAVLLVSHRASTLARAHRVVNLPAT